jgi:hypothetical protein
MAIKKVFVKDNVGKFVDEWDKDGPWTKMAGSIAGCIEDTRTADEMFRDQEWIVAPNFLYNQKYRPLMTYFKGRFIDRTGDVYTDIGFNQIVESPLPQTITVTANDWDQCCDQRGRELIAEAEQLNLPISALWSGGMDSTTTIVALLKGQAKKIRVIHTDDSINEHPWLYDILKEHQQLEWVKVERPLQEINDQSLIVSGEGGGELYVTIAWTRFIPGLKQNGLVEGSEQLTSILMDPEPLAHVPDPYRSLLMPMIDRCPTTYKHNVDWMWWLMHSLKSGFLGRRMELNSGRIQPTLRHFFLAPEFDRWGLTHDHREKIPGMDWNNLKMPMRNYMFDYLNDRRVYEMKKYASMPNSHPEIASATHPGRRMGIVRYNGVLGMEAF